MSGCSLFLGLSVLCSGVSLFSVPVSLCSRFFDCFCLFGAGVPDFGGMVFGILVVWCSEFFGVSGHSRSIK